MEVNEYQTSAMTTCTESSKNLSYMLLNLVGEVGEFASKVAKGIRKGKMRIKNNHIETLSTSRLDNFGTEKELKLEAGDILWQLSGICSVMGWSLEEVAQMNLDKLKERQSRGTIVGDGDFR